MPVDIIVASSTPAVQAAKNATKTVPIVMTGSADPVGTGLVASLAQPGGNITGLSSMLPELAGKRLELLKDIVPKLSSVAFLAHGGDPAHRLFVKEAQEAGEKLRIQIQPVVIGASRRLRLHSQRCSKTGPELLSFRHFLSGLLMTVAGLRNAR